MIELSRRHFLVLIPAGAAVLAAACGSSSNPDCASAGTVMTTGTALVVVSSCNGSGAGHTHDYTIMDSDLATPPAAGLSDNTSPYDDDQHVHTMVLTQADLQAIHAGQTVTKTSGTTLGHAHVFDFKSA